VVNYNLSVLHGCKIPKPQRV